MNRQHKKLEKDRRRRAYNDLQVQGTNNSSIVSKRSVEMLYLPILNPGSTEWFKVFVPKAKRRSPAINRGYWVRMEAIKRIVLAIALQNPSTPVKVVNLGCGFDPLPFQLFEAHRDANVQFFDFDYPELVENKAKMMLSSPAVLDVIGPLNTPDKSLGVRLSSDRYKLVGCDLKDGSRYEHQVRALVADERAVHIFVAEVSLAYMPHADADRIVELSSKTPNSHFIILEQLLPVETFFSEKMLYHFSHLRSPLKCVERYPQPADQAARFRQWFGAVEMANLHQAWAWLVDRAERERVAQVEPFDEWEEFLVFAQHYAVTHAYNGGSPVFPADNSTDSVELFDREPVLSVETPSQHTVGLVDAAPLEVKFAATCALGDKILVHGGLGQSRSAQLLAVAPKTQPTTVATSGADISARMCHTLTTLSCDKCLLVGGRAGPGKEFKDVYLGQYTDAGVEWTQLPDIPVGRARHATVAVSSTQVLVLGGGSGVVVYDISTGSSREVLVRGGPEVQAAVRARGCCVARDERTGRVYVVGGELDAHGPTAGGSLVELTFSPDLASADARVVVSLAALERLGAQMACVDGRLFVVGGVSPNKLFDSGLTVVSISVPEHAASAVGRVELVPFAREPWAQRPVLIGHSVAVVGARVHIIAGGAVCYSFGSAYSAHYEIV